MGFFSDAFKSLASNQEQPRNKHYILAHNGEECVAIMSYVDCERAFELEERICEILVSAYHKYQSQDREGFVRKYCEEDDFDDWEEPSYNDEGDRFDEYLRKHQGLFSSLFRKWPDTNLAVEDREQLRMMTHRVPNVADAESTISAGLGAVKAACRLAIRTAFATDDIRFGKNTLRMPHGKIEIAEDGALGIEGDATFNEQWTRSEALIRFACRLYVRYRKLSRSGRVTVSIVKDNSRFFHDLLDDE